MVAYNYIDVVYSCKNYGMDNSAKRAGTGNFPIFADLYDGKHCHRRAKVAQCSSWYDGIRFIKDNEKPAKVKDIYKADITRLIVWDKEKA